VVLTGFLTEAVYDLQHRLQDRNSGLLVRFGLPEEIVVNIVKALQARGDEVVAFEMQKEVSSCVAQCYRGKLLDSPFYVSLSHDHRYAQKSEPWKGRSRKG
jgi:deoxyribodipyrimidine photolyase